MGSIRVLPDHLANQIAAGEVVERPASALKELLENSFDAGATEIRVILQAGGKRRIRVEDNGCGMDRDDCLMALERHATSKLTRAEDLFSIRTLGFRGEALPSIASVSRFTLESRTRDADAGVRVEVHGSKLSKVTEIPRNPGTTITIDQLFFNIPARKKFLRTTETELSWMVNLVTQYAIAHADKHFYLEHNGKVMIDVTPVKKLEERIYQLYGKKMLDRLVPVSFEKDWLNIRGLVSTPDVFKTSRAYQHLFVNGRLVRDRVLNHAISEAYAGFGEGKVYPIVFLFLDMPSTEIDVNVHPAKTEIKFISAGFVHHSVKDAVRATLVERKLTIPYRFREGYHQHPSEGRRPDPWSKPREQQTVLPDADPAKHTPLFAPPRHNPEPQGNYGRFMQDHGTLPAPHADTRSGETPAPEPEAAAEQPTKSQTQPEPPPPPPADPGLFATQKEVLTRPRIIGQFRDSYILAEQEGDLLLIDQHVAHERILYDRIKEQLEEGTIERQGLLVPMTIELTPQQAVEMTQLLPKIRQFGFDLDAFDGNTFVIREVPTFAQNEPVEKLVVELVEKAQGQRRETTLEDIIDHFAATKACKAAVKINMHLTPEKMNHLLDTLWKTSSPLFCPHGRPIILRFSNEEIEKNFHRR
ncbi:MAG: DNA mismatch repair endonuclease MutL [Acidobacteriota bacterium]|nr:DNA mismatch repair endonuclease MutL [Acidobacteriota bacterium]